MSCCMSSVMIGFVNKRQYDHFESGGFAKRFVGCVPRIAGEKEFFIELGLKKISKGESSKKFREIDGKKEEEEDDVDDENDHLKKTYEMVNKDFIREIEAGLNDYIPEGNDSDFESEDDMNARRKYRKEFLSSDNDTDLQYVKVIQANACGSLYYVTFEAEDTISRKVKVYQSKVYCCPRSDDTTIYLFMEK
ncbi:hypothetical protein Cni_G06932 [Canna indica]|uniref:Cystatin domain-containing protein n=1 Tax=Canna indica TaxID=4628 RepID=A0AAQ3K0A0_9LILI|nr:hypothetical protein Cni_G06932 [Canna indica]